MTMPLKLFVRLVATVAVVSALTMPAKAATQIFASSVFNSTGAVVDPGNAVGATDAAAAVLDTGGDLVLSFAPTLTGGGIELNLLPIGVSGAVNAISLSIGEVIGGVATFSSEILLLDMGTGGMVTADLTASCAGISATGCSLIRIRNAGALFGSTGMSLDSVSGVTTAPEPSAWALMILAFGVVGWRIKTMRKSSAERFDELAKGRPANLLGTSFA